MTAPIQKKLKILNLYAGIGGNRRLWGDEHEIVAVEFDAAIAKAYQKRYPNDTVIVGDAKQYLLDHYKEFDFIWASPPCQTHSDARQCRVRSTKPTALKAEFIDMSLYQIIIFLKHNNLNSFKWVVENVIPYYTPIIKEDVKIDRHLYWSNFNISEISITKDRIIEDVKASDLDFIIGKEHSITNKIQVVRNQVNYEVGKHILDCAMGTVQHKQGGLF